MIISWFLRLILLLIIVRLVWRFLAGIIDGLTPEAPSAPKAKTSTLVRDPVCGTFVVRGRAVTIGDGPQKIYFCSEKCRNDYASRGLSAGARSDAKPGAGAARR
jgi:YHS domain-containing protein